MSLRITLLGTGVGIPRSGRSQSAVLLDNGQPLLFDCGAGTILRLEQAGVSTESLDTVVLTHLHLDHVSDLLALANARYLQQLPGPEVYGPEGTDIYFKIVRSAYPNLERMQVSVHEVKPKDCFSVKGCDILAEEAKHSVTALAYRIQCGGRIVAYSGDTEPSPAVAGLAEGADLLIHECSFPEPFEVTNHSTPRKLAEVLKGLNVKRLVLTHLYPEANGLEAEMERELQLALGIPVEVGCDLQTICIDV